MERRKTALRTWIAAIVLVLASIGLLQSILDLRTKKDLLRERQETYKRLTQENRELQARLQEAATPEFVEREARNRLGMGKTGETVILTDGIRGKQSETGQELLPEADPTWKQWWSLFF